MSATGPITGGVVSARTVTVKVLVAVFPEWSVAVHVTVVVPIGNVEPDAGEQVTGTAPSMSSVAVGVGYVTTAPDAPDAALVMSDTGPITGGVVSVATVTLKVAVLVFPDASEAEQVTVVVPTGNDEPDGGTQLTVAGPLIASVAVGSA
jgi:hypothetical protein